METDPSVLSFAVAYQEFTGPPNPDLRGKGHLTIHPAGPSYRFTGDARVVFGRPTALELHPEEIRNVSCSGRKVEFTTPAGVAGKKRQPFVFYCATPEAAATVTSLLPGTRDPDFVTSHDFGRTLSTLPAAASPWSSVTNVIVAANAVAFVVMGSLGAGWIVPADITPYVLYAANNGGATTDGEWWRIVTAMFVHYGLIHLLLNMWALFQTGHFVERLFGRSLFALGYLGSGIVASFTSLYWHRDEIWSAGASGAVFGVYGLLLAFMLRERQSIPKPVLRPLFKSTITFAGYNLVFGMAHPQIDNAAHLGGLLGGVALGWVMALPIEPGVRTRLAPARLKLGAFVVLAITLLAGALAPRFDYRFREELKWADVVRGPSEREPDLLEQQQQQLRQAQSGPGQELPAWLEQQVIPFYTAWRDQLVALELTPGLRTAEHRRNLVTLIETKLANYRRLAADVRGNDASAIPRYLAAEQQAHAEARPPDE